MSDRKPLSARTRFEIFKRDRFQCQYCGACPPNVVLHVDHIVSVYDGGGNDPGNLATSCDRCNLGKGARSLGDIPKSLQDMADEASERREQAEQYAALIQAERDAFEEWCWDVAEILEPGARNGFSRSKFTSITAFVRRLGFGETWDSAQIAADRWSQGTTRFKYFCGICWRKIREAEGDANG